MHLHADPTPAFEATRRRLETFQPHPRRSRKRTLNVRLCEQPGPLDASVVFEVATQILGPRSPSHFVFGWQSEATSAAALAKFTAAGGREVGADDLYLSTESPLEAVGRRMGDWWLRSQTLTLSLSLEAFAHPLGVDVRAFWPVLAALTRRLDLKHLELIFNEPDQAPLAATLIHAVSYV